MSAAPHSTHATPIDWCRALPILDTGRSVLREPRLSDAASLAEMLGNDDVARFMSRPPSTSSGFERFIAWVQNERQSGRSFCYGIVPPGRDHAVGVIQVRRLEPGFGNAEWGFALGPPFWGAGIFMPSAIAVADFVFRHAGARRLEARATVENGRGNGVLRKAGAMPEGLLRRSLSIHQGQVDQILWAMMGEEWYAAHPHAPYRLIVDAPQPPEVEPPTGRLAAIPAWRQAIPIVGDDVVTLRELRASDVPRLLDVLRDPAALEYVHPPPPTAADFERYVAWTHDRREAGRYIALGIVPAGEPHAVGLVEVRQLDPSFKTAEWGFVVGREYWGTGLFARAAAHVLALIFDYVGVRRLEARVAVSNDRGNAVLRKLGATREGQLRRSFLHAGQYVDDVLWALLDDDRPPRAATAVEPNRSSVVLMND
jgi:[ribosomal protein S5]-alanine N-acetyltransferase